MPILKTGMGKLTPKICATCGGIMKELEDVCPVCKARAYEGQQLKQRLELIQSRLSRT